MAFNCELDADKTVAGKLLRILLTGDGGPYKFRKEFNAEEWNKFYVQDQSLHIAVELPKCLDRFQNLFQYVH